MNILVVDDEKVQIETIRRGLLSRGHKVSWALSAGEALAQLQDKEIDLVLTDYLMPGENGLELLNKIRDLYNTMPVIIMTAYGEKKLLIDALHNRCNGFIDKPFTLDELIKEIECAKANILQNTNSERFSKMLPRLLHQVSNPLMSILASAEMAAKTPESDQDIKQYIDDIREGVMQIKEINMEIAHLNRAAENRIEVIPLTSVLSNSLKAFRNMFTLKGIDCEEKNLDDLDVDISGNRFDLEQVFKNLILNAVDSMDGWPHKKLTVTVKKNPASSSVSIQIKDTGCGIQDDQKENLFKQYVTTKSQGTGLGLHIVKMITEKHGGMVCTQSKIGEGSEFTVTLPVLNS